jgi:hypothetical protein
MTLHKTNDPFDVIGACGRRESIAHGVVILRGFALEMEQPHHRRIAACGDGLAVSAYDDARRPLMSAAVTNCGGRLGLETARLSLPPA